MYKVLPVLFFLSAFSFAQDVRTSQMRQFHKSYIWESFSNNYNNDTVDRSAYDAAYYKLDLTISFEPNLLQGKVTARFNIIKPGVQNIILDFDNSMTISAVSGPVSSFEHSGRRLEITLDRIYNTGDDIELNIIYAGLPDDGNNRWFVFDRLSDGSHHVWTLSEPYGAKFWWPCKDTPVDKPDSVDIIVTVPQNQVVASNGLLRSEQLNDNGTRTFHWHESYPIATYLVSLAIAPYANFKDSYFNENNDEMLLDYYVYPAREELAKQIFAMVKDHLDALSYYFGPYPFFDEKYGMAQFGWPGGMEHQTISSIGAVSANWQFIYVHELAHQWFGDALSCASWTDIWLNEGFASYSEALYAEWAGFNTWSPGPDAYKAYINSQRYIGPGKLILDDTTSIANIFAPIVYDKGSWVLHMLRYVLGDEFFFMALKEYASDPELQYAAVTTEDFKNICEHVSGIELDSFFDQWLNFPYFPTYSYTFKTITALSENQYQVNVTILQEQLHTVYEMPVELQFFYESGGDTTVRVYNYHREQQYDIILNGWPVMLKLDPDNHILKEARDRSAGTYSDQLKIEKVYPNPAKDDVTIRLRSWNQGHHEIIVYNIKGQEITRLSPFFSSTTHEFVFSWDRRNAAGYYVSPGVYFLKARYNGKKTSQIRKVVITR